MRRKNRILDEWCEVAGRDPALIERGVEAGLEDIDQAEAFLAAGITHIALFSDGPSYRMDGLDEWIAWRDEKNS